MNNEDPKEGYGERGPVSSSNGLLVGMAVLKNDIELMFAEPPPSPLSGLAHERSALKVCACHTLRTGSGSHTSRAWTRAVAWSKVCLVGD